MYKAINVRTMKSCVEYGFILCVFASCLVSGRALFVYSDGGAATEHTSPIFLRCDVRIILPDDEAVRLTWLHFQPQQYGGMTEIFTADLSQDQHAYFFTGKWAGRGQYDPGSLGNIRLPAHFVTRDDAGIYRCQVNSLLSQAFADVTVNVFFGPGTSITITPGGRVQRDEGSSLTLTCSAQCNPLCTFRWYKSGRRLQNSPVLEMYSLNKTDAGLYACQARNEAGRSIKPLDLRIRYPANIVELTTGKVETESLRTGGTKSESVLPKTVKCVSNGWPEARFHWYKNDAPLSSSNGEISEILDFATGQKVSTLKLSQKDCQIINAFYKCEVFNGIGNVSEATMEVKVPCKPKAVQLSGVCDKANLKDEHIELLINETKSASFCFYGYPYPSMILSRVDDNNKVIVVEDVNVTCKSGTNVCFGTVDFFLTKPEDYTSYMVEIKNVHGQFETVVTIEANQPPFTPTGFHVANVTENSACFTWVPGFNGGHKQTFSLQIHLFSGSEQLVDSATSHSTKVEELEFEELFENAKTEEKEACLDTLRPSTDYIAVLAVYNARGPSQESLQIRFETSVQKSTLTPIQTTKSPEFILFYTSRAIISNYSSNSSGANNNNIDKTLSEINRKAITPSTTISTTTLINNGLSLENDETDNVRNTEDRSDEGHIKESKLADIAKLDDDEDMEVDESKDIDDNDDEDNDEDFNDFDDVDVPILKFLDLFLRDLERGNSSYDQIWWQGGSSVPKLYRRMSYTGKKSISKYFEGPKTIDDPNFTTMNSNVTIETTVTPQGGSGKTGKSKLPTHQTMSGLRVIVSCIVVACIVCIALLLAICISRRRARGVVTKKCVKKKTVVRQCAQNNGQRRTALPSISVTLATNESGLYESVPDLRFVVNENARPFSDIDPRMRPGVSMSLDSDSNIIRRAGHQGSNSLSRKSSAPEPPPSLPVHLTAKLRSSCATTPFPSHVVTHLAPVASHSQISLSHSEQGLKQKHTKRRAPPSPAHVIAKVVKNLHSSVETTTHHGVTQHTSSPGNLQRHKVQQCQVPIVKIEGHRVSIPFCLENYNRLSAEFSDRKLCPKDSVASFSSTNLTLPRGSQRNPPSRASSYSSLTQPKQAWLGSGSNSNSYLDLYDGLCKSRSRSPSNIYDPLDIRGNSPTLNGNHHEGSLEIPDRRSGDFYKARHSVPNFSCVVEEIRNSLSSMTNELQIPLSKRYSASESVKVRHENYEDEKVAYLQDEEFSQSQDYEELDNKISMKGNGSLRPLVQSDDTQDDYERCFGQEYLRMMRQRAVKDENKVTGGDGDIELRAHRLYNVYSKKIVSSDDAHQSKPNEKTDDIDVCTYPKLLEAKISKDNVSTVISSNCDDDILSTKMTDALRHGYHEMSTVFQSGNRENGPPSVYENVH